MKKRIITRIMIVLLALCILAGSSPDVFNSVQALSDSSLSVDGLIENAQVLDTGTVPEIIPYEEAVAAGHIQRAYDEETNLSSIVFQNSDNTNTLYMFDENVKYIGADGLIHDKNNALQKNTDGSYKNIANDIQINYPAEIATGILLEANGHTLRVIPQYSQNAKVSVALTSKSSEDIRSVSYNRVFGQNTSLIYTQTFSGFKEDIILHEKSDLNTFSFTVLTNGSSICVQDGAVVAVSNGIVWGRFGDVLVYDSNNAMIQGETLVTEVVANREYTVTLAVPSEFLLSSDIVYPVVIDPTFQISSISSAANIQDLTLFSGNSANFGTSAFLYIGNSNLVTSITSDDYGIARTYIKFPGLTSHSQFNEYYNAGRVTSVKLNFADINCTSGPTDIAAYLCSYSWTESSMYNPSMWYSYSSAAGTSLVTISPQAKSIPYPRYQIEIKQFIDYWRSGKGTDNGIVLKAQDESLKAVLIGSSESGDAYSRSDSKPYLVVTYTAMPTSQSFTPISNGLYQFINLSTDKALTYTTSFSANTCNPTSASQRFKLTYAGSGMYYIETMYSGAQGKRISYDGSSLFVASASSSVYQKWYIVPDNSGYRIHSAYDSNYLLSNSSDTNVIAQNSTVNSTWGINLICLDVPLIEQQDTDTCSAASALMLLHYYGCTDITEDDYIEAAGGKDFSDFNYVYNIKNVINRYLSQYSYEVTYSYLNIGSYTETQFLQIIQNNMENSHPIIAGIKVQDENYFPYTTSGHYVVITGVFFDSSDNTYYAVINDPHYDHCAEYVMPVSVILAYIKAGNQHIIKVD